MTDNVVRLGDAPPDNNQGRAADVRELRRMLPELLALADAKASTAEMFSAAIDAAAYSSSASKTAIRKLVTAMSKDKTRDMFTEAVELADLIEAVVPEVANEARSG